MKTNKANIFYNHLIFHVKIKHYILILNFLLTLHKLYIYQVNIVSVFAPVYLIAGVKRGLFTIWEEI